MNQEITSDVTTNILHESFNEQYFNKLVSRLQKTVAKVRRIDLAELLELAWVDGTLEPFADRLMRSRPELHSEIEAICQELRASD